MLTRTHSDGAKKSTAVYSKCMTYRYRLSRHWNDARNTVVYIMLNPSTADEIRNDPTIERCERRAIAEGFDGFDIVNLFAFRSTDPKHLLKQTEPEGPDNAAQIHAAVESATMIIAAWGVHGAHNQMGPRLLDQLQTWRKSVYHLGLTKAGHPRHPLYVPYAVRPQTFAEPGFIQD